MNFSDKGQSKTLQDIIKPLEVIGFLGLTVHHKVLLCNKSKSRMTAKHRKMALCIPKIKNFRGIT